MTISKPLTTGIAAAAFVAAVSLAYAQTSTDAAQTQPADSTQVQQTPATPATPAAQTDSSMTTTQSDTGSTAPSTDMSSTPERAPQADRN